MHRLLLPMLLLAVAVPARGEAAQATDLRAEEMRLISSMPAVDADDIQLDARPLFGQGTPATSGWVSYLVNVSNRGNSTASGTVRLLARTGNEDDDAHVYAETRFTVAPASVTHLELPVHDAAVADMVAAAFDPAGNPLGTVAAGITTPSEPLLVDFTEPSRIGPRVVRRPLSTRFVPSTFAHYAVPSLAVASLQRDLLDDHLLLPRFPAGYASATLVLLRSSQLAQLPAEELKALVGWVLAGGSVALVVDRPKDTQAAHLRGLVGGACEELPLDPEGPHAVSLKLTIGRKTLEPAQDVLEELVIYRGGNLRQTPWGSAASYGLGEVHLLAFDPTSSRHASDRWVQRQVLDLASYAWDRSAQLVVPLGGSGFENQIPDELRRTLDPSQGKLWVIVLAGFSLVAYALLAGPLNFFLARRAGSGMRAIWRVPLWAALASTCLVLLGMTSKGGSGHAHRLSLLEAGAGMARGSVVRYRALFTDSELLSVVPTTSLALLDVLGPRSETPRTFTVGHFGAKLEELRHRPWHTVFVREDGVLELGEGVSLVGAPASLQVVNRTGRDLVAVLLHVPGGDLRFFPRIVRGERVAASAGDLVRVGTGSSGRRLHALDIAALKYRLDRAAPGAADAWLALRTASHRATDWWPADVPVLLAQVDASVGGRDSDLPLEQNRLLLRVVGYGGTP